MKLSLTHYLIRCEREHGIHSDLRLLLETVARACKTIS
ncbi:MAG TPA: fructose-bisphosphatase class I, partial [Burkholderiaceae bacterium]|nr:fructose-bisphosphatase class I [Burkholderiaceae bacterium]